MEKDLKLILTNGQQRISGKKFKKTGWWTYGKIGFGIFGLALILLFIIASFSAGTSETNPNYSTFQDKIFQLLPLWIFATSAFLITLFITQRNNKRNIAFKLLEELNSTEFLKVRYDLGNQIRLAQKEKRDVDRFSGWFPHISLLDETRKVENWELPGNNDFDGYLANHSLAKLVYFVLRISNYSKHGMIDMKLTKHLFHFFFAHYETLLLEFARGIKIKRHFYNEQFAFDFDERWDLCPERIEYFFVSIGLSGKLPNDYHYVYFPSLNKKIDSNSILHNIKST